MLRGENKIPGLVRRSKRSAFFDLPLAVLAQGVISGAMKSTRPWVRKNLSFG
jgi:hypothetical protein